MSHICDNSNSPSSVKATPLPCIMCRVILEREGETDPQMLLALCPTCRYQLLWGMAVSYSAPHAVVLVVSFPGFVLRYFLPPEDLSWDISSPRRICPGIFPPPRAFVLGPELLSQDISSPPPRRICPRIFPPPYFLPPEHLS